MPSQTGPGIKRCITKGLCGCGINHLKKIDSHFVSKYFQFIDQGNIHGTKGVFKQLGQFSCLGSRYRHHPCNGVIYGRSNFKAGRGDAPDHFRNIGCSEFLVSRVFSLGRKCEEKILSHLHIMGFKPRQKHFFGRSGIRCTLKNNKLPGSQVVGNGLGGFQKIAQIRLHFIGKRRRHTDQNAVCLL